MRRLLGVLSAVALVLVTAPAASAWSWSHDDPTGDVATCYTPDDSCDPAPDEADADVTRVQVNHNKRYVQLFMTTRDSDRSSDNSFTFEVQNGRHQVRLVQVNTYPHVGKPDGVLRVLDEETFRPVRCRGTKGFHIDWARHATAITIPRTCVGRPKVLRVRGGASWGEEHGNYSFADLATTATLANPTSSGPWGPWVKRG